MCRAFGVNIGQEAWIAIPLFLVILFTWIRNLDDLAIISLIANFCILFSLGVITYEEIYQLTTPYDSNGPHPPKEVAAIRWTHIDLSVYKTLPLYFGGVVYAFEGIGVVSSSSAILARFAVPIECSYMYIS